MNEGDRIGAYVQRTLSGLYIDRDRDLLAAFEAWGRTDLVEHGCIIDQGGRLPFGWELTTEPDGSMHGSIDTRVLVADDRLRGLDYDGPATPAAYAEALAAGRLSTTVDYDRIAREYAGRVFRIVLLDPAENRKLPPVDVVPERPLGPGED